MLEETLVDPGFPLIDLHRHLDGSVRLSTILELGKKHGIELPGNTVEEIRPHVQIVNPRPGVMAFIEKFMYMIGVLADYESCERIAFENVEDAWREGLDYIELRFSPLFMAEPHHLDPAGVVESVLQGIQAGTSSFDIQVNLIGIISRTYGPDQGWRELEAILEYREGITALDLAGDEKNYPGNLFVDHILEAKDAGLRITIHAGEESGPDSIWQAVEELQAERIGHGISAVQDPMLMDYLQEQKIGVECNLTSNFQTRVVEDLSKHPIRDFLNHGILATINTDDPGISGIDLRHEYRIARDVVGLSQNQIHKAQENALQLAFLSPAEKESLLEKSRNV
jgi:adenosine deaminase